MKNKLKDFEKNSESFLIWRRKYMKFDEVKNSVNEWICDVTNGDVGETGKVLYRNERGEPVLVRGNVDEAVSNLQVIILTEKNGKSIFLDYHPGLSMQDKKLIPSEEPPILDFTVY